MSYPRPFVIGDLVEYMRDLRPDRSKFGIILNVKKIIGAYQLEVFWGDKTGFIDSRYVEKRCR